MLCDNCFIVKVPGRELVQLSGKKKTTKNRTPPHPRSLSSKISWEAFHLAEKEDDPPPTPRQETNLVRCLVVPHIFLAACLWSKAADFFKLSVVFWFAVRLVLRFPEKRRKDTGWGLPPLQHLDTSRTKNTRFFWTRHILLLLHSSQRLHVKPEKVSVQGRILPRPVLCHLQNLVLALKSTLLNQLHPWLSTQKASTGSPWVDHAFQLNCTSVRTQCEDVKFSFHQKCFSWSLENCALILFCSFSWWNGKTIELVSLLMLPTLLIDSRESHSAASFSYWRILISVCEWVYSFVPGFIRAFRTLISSQTNVLCTTNTSPIDIHVNTFVREAVYLKKTNIDCDRYHVEPQWKCNLIFSRFVCTSQGFPRFAWDCNVFTQNLLQN